MELAGKTVLITGAAQRLGKEMALHLAACGAHIILHYRSSKKAALALAQEIEAYGVRCIPVQADFTEPIKISAIQAFVKKVYQLSKTIDVLINNASIFYPTPLGKINDKDWDAFIAINLKTPFFLAQEIGARMVKQGSGKIINMIDCAIYHPRADYLPYTIAKGGLATATVGLARALAPKVQVNGIAPGPILPPKGGKGKNMNKIINTTLLKRFGTPEDIVATVRYLIEGTDYVTGEIITVDGGSLIR